LARRVGWYFIFIGIVLLAVAFVLAMGQQPSGRVLFWALGSVVAGVWVVLRSGSARPAAPAAPPAEAKAKSAPKAPAAAPAKETKPHASKPKGISAMFQPRSKSRNP
jgi:hypothetical protein